jgi:hypothetical protein
LTFGAAIAVSALLVGAIGSGARGGPLQIESPLLFLVLLAPVARADVLRQPVLRQLTIGGVVGAVLGAAVAWALSSRFHVHLDHLVVSGVLSGVLVTGTALVGATLHLRRPAAWAVRLAIAGWTAADLFALPTSPMASLAHLGLAPRLAWPDASAAAVTLAVATVAVLRAGHVSLEQAWRRSASADQLRVAIGLNDFRTAVLLLRRRANEGPRTSPWLHVDIRRDAVLARDVHAFLRWPAVRWVRFAAFAVATGALARWAPAAPVLWSGVPLLGYLASLDAADPLAEEFDHPFMAAMLPLHGDRLLARHLIATTALVALFHLLSTATLAAFGAPGTEVLAALVLVLPAAVAGTVGAGLTASTVARPLTKLTDIALPPEALVPKIGLKVIAPLLPLAGVLIAPLAAAAAGASVPAAAARGLPGVVLTIGMAVWIRLTRR